MRPGSRRGSALIEAAIVLPVFALLACGAADYARALYLGQVAAASARAGAHRALIESPQSLGAIEQAAIAAAGDARITARATRECVCQVTEQTRQCDAVRCTGSRFTYVRVETGFELQPLLRYPGMASPYRAHGEATVRVE
jgi:Flp pilus assembly protein TadG